MELGISSKQAGDLEDIVIQYLTLNTIIFLTKSRVSLFMLGFFGAFSYIGALTQLYPAPYAKIRVFSSFRSGLRKQAKTRILVSPCLMSCQVNIVDFPQLFVSMSDPLI